jgi:hypothetical protein
LKPSREHDEREPLDVGAPYAGVAVSVVPTAGEQIAIATAAGNPTGIPECRGKQMIPESQLVSFALQASIYAVFLLPAMQALIALEP